SLRSAPFDFASLQFDFSKRASPRSFLSRNSTRRGRIDELPTAGIAKKTFNLQPFDARAAARLGIEDDQATNPSTHPSISWHCSVVNPDSKERLNVQIRVTADVVLRLRNPSSVRLRQLHGRSGRGKGEPRANSWVGSHPNSAGSQPSRRAAS